MKKPTIEQLISYNKDIKRRVYLSDEYPDGLVDADGNLVKIERIFHSEVIAVPDRAPNPSYAGNPYDHIRVHEFRPDGCEPLFLTDTEAKLVLGRDHLDSFYSGRSEIAEISAMLEAARMPSEISNAYFLGEYNNGLDISGGCERMRNLVPFPVQYFKINSARCKTLEANKEQLARLVDKVFKERRKRKLDNHAVTP